MAAVVVYVHGLWLNGAEGLLLRRRLSRLVGAETRSFAYSSVSMPLEANAAALLDYLTAVRTDRLHLVAHSLGGILVLALFERLARSSSDSLPPGRVVLMGSPVCGSISARRLVRLPFGRRMLGRTAADGLLTPREPRWNGDRELGIIAGAAGHGLGRVLGPMRQPNDGTVLVEETRLPGASDRVTLDTSHSGMVFSGAVARQVAAFLQAGRFAR